MSISHEDHKTLILKATNSLLAVCDGALTLDGHGFNGGHAQAVRRIVGYIRINDFGVNKLQRMLNTYRNSQLPVYLSQEEITTLFEKEYEILDKTPIQSTFSARPPVPRVVRCVPNGKENFYEQKSGYIEELVNWTKSLPPAERKYNPTSYSWSVHIRHLDTLHAFCVEKSIELIIEEQVEEALLKIRQKIELSNKASSDFQVSGLTGELMPFQRAGVQFLDVAEGKAMIGDQMGLGKTIQALAYLQLHQIKPALIVVPASLKINWEREAEKWLTYTKRIQRLKNGKIVPLTGDIVIINYDVLGKWAEILQAHGFQIIIFDESHYLKNQKAQRTQHAQNLAAKIAKKVLLTGTPILNRPNELYQQLRIVNPEEFDDKSFFQFAKRYCDAKQVYVGGRKGYAWDFSGASNTQELHEKLKHMVIRRTKDQVLKELPDKRRTTFEFEIAPAFHGELEALEESYQVAKAEGQTHSGELLTLIEQMKQVAVKGKLEAVVSWISEFLENDEKLIVFATHHFAVDAIMAAFPEISVKLTGESSQDERQRAVDQFQNNPKIRLFVGNIKAAGVGITLTAASTVAFIEFAWTPGEHEQAEDRAHRIGQKNAVNIYYLISNTDIERKIAQLIQAKSAILGAVLDGDMQGVRNLSIFKDLVESFEV